MSPFALPVCISKSLWQSVVLLLLAKEEDLLEKGGVFVFVNVDGDDRLDVDDNVDAVDHVDVDDH